MNTMTDEQYLSYVKNNLIKSVTTEKSMKLIDNGVLTFIVKPHCNKTDLKIVLSKMLDIKIYNIKTATYKAEKIVFKGKKGYKSAFKKVMLTVSKEDIAKVRKAA